jgi:hypothetical protein
LEPLPAVAGAESGFAATIDSSEGEGDEDRQSDQLAQKLRLLVDNYERVEASDLNRLIEREADYAVEVIRKWNARR